MGRLVWLGWVATAGFSQTTAGQLIESGHWKRARTMVEARMGQAPRDAEVHFLLSQIRNAFGDHTAPLPLAEEAEALDARTAKYHRQVAEVLGVMAQHSNAFQQLLLARRFRKEIDAALGLDPRDVQALRDLMEFYLLAPGIAGGNRWQAEATAERIAAVDPVEGWLARARVAAWEKRPADSQALLQKAAATRPLRYRALMALAQFDLAREHFDLAPAETASKEALRLDPGRAEAYGLLAEIYADQSRWSELDPLLEDAAREVPDDLAPFYRAAERIVAGGHDFDRAERYLRAYLAQEPEGNEPTLAEAKHLLTRIAKDAAKGL